MFCVKYAAEQETLCSAEVATRERRGPSVLRLAKTTTGLASIFKYATVTCLASRYCDVVLSYVKLWLSFASCITWRCGAFGPEEYNELQTS